MADLWTWNMSDNNLAYARASFGELYGNNQERFQSAVSFTSSDGLRRIWAPFDSAGFGPLNSMLDSRTEVTYGYNPLELARYAAYLDASRQNPRLLDSLGVTAKLDAAKGRFYPNPSALSRVTGPAGVMTVGSNSEAAARLRALDPAREAIVEGRSVVQGGPVEARIVSYTGSEYRIRFRAAGPALLRIAVPYFPGWRAEVEGTSVAVFPVDLALSGVIVPAGSHELVFRYQSTWFRTGALISAISWTGLALWFAWPLLATVSVRHALRLPPASRA
jgi:hypothetical protein